MSERLGIVEFELILDIYRDILTYLELNIRIRRRLVHQGAFTHYSLIPTPRGPTNAVEGEAFKTPTGFGELSIPKFRPKLLDCLLRTDQPGSPQGQGTTFHWGSRLDQRPDYRGLCHLTSGATSSSAG